MQHVIHTKDELQLNKFSLSPDLEVQLLLLQHKECELLNGAMLIEYEHRTFLWSELWQNKA